MERARRLRRARLGRAAGLHRARCVRDRLARPQGVNPYLGDGVRDGLLRPSISVPLSFIVLRLRGAQFAIGTWVVAEAIAICVSFDNQLGAGTGTSLLADRHATRRRARALHLLADARHDGVLPRLALRPAAQPPRRLAAGDPRRRGGRGVGRRARRRRQADPLHARAARCGGGGSDDARKYALHRAGLDLQRQLHAPS